MFFSAVRFLWFGVVTIVVCFIMSPYWPGLIPNGVWRVLGPVRRAFLSFVFFFEEKGGTEEGRERVGLKDGGPDRWVSAAGCLKNGCVLMLRKPLFMLFGWCLLSFEILVLRHSVIATSRTNQKNRRLEWFSIHCRTYFAFALVPRAPALLGR